MKTNLLLKKATVLLFFFIGLSGTAQETDNTWAAAVNRVFAGLDKSKIPYHLLKDYAMEFTDLEVYNGELSENNFLHRGHFVSIYNTLLMARTQTEVPSLVSPEEFEDRWDALRAPNHIVLSGLYYKYSKFKENVYPDYINVEGEVISDKYVNGVWQNPYETQEVFAVSSPILYYQGLSFSVEFPQSLFYTNRPGTLQSLAIDFGDGQGYREMAFGQVVEVTYPEEGVYNWTYKFTFADGIARYSHSKMYFEGLAAANNCAGAEQISFSGTRQWQGEANDAILEIDYANNDCELNKVLIVAEGFDSGLLGVENGLGDNDYNDFNFETFASSQLVSELNTYDIVYVNWKDGRDYLQRNAWLLQDIIEWVNEEKVGEAPLVVLGQSMGGVIARYALRDMENRGIDHETRLYVSHDAPHQGANIPLGILYFARHLTQTFVSTPVGDQDIPIGAGAPITIEDIEEMLDAPGTQQLLKHNVNYEFSLSSFPYYVDTSLHDAWQTELENMGYPQQTRNIAISNGNFCGNPQNFSPSDELFKLSGNVGTSFLTNALLHFLPFTNGYLAIILAVQFEPSFILSALPGDSDLDMYFRANALPSQGNIIEIYKGKITYTKTIYVPFPIPISDEIVNLSITNPVNILPYDYYPGGRYSIPFAVDTTSNGTFGNYGFLSSSVDSFDFIPVPSALDVGSGNVTLTNSDYLNVYSKANPPASPKDIPFHNFTTSIPNNHTLNEIHISFNTRNGNWLAKELIADPTNPEYPPVADCTFLCSNFGISGNDPLCNVDVFSVPADVPNPNWSIIENANLVNYTESGNSITITDKDDYESGFITIKVSFGNQRCGYSSAVKKVWVGAPKVPNGSDITGVDKNVYITESDAVFAPDLSAGVQYHWKIAYNNNPCLSDPNANLPYFSGYGSNNVLTSSSSMNIIWGDCPGTFTILCYASNGCDETTLIGTEMVEVHDYSSDEPCNNLVVNTSPNPVEGGVLFASIEAPPPCPPIGGDEPNNYLIEATIYDMQGNVRVSQNFNSLEFAITELGVLEQGSYILNILMDNGKKGEEIIIVE